MDFHIVFHSIHNFCVLDMSNFYLDIIKDRLYCEKPDGVLRRAAQTTMYKILDALTRMLAPILAFTAEEIWSFMPHAKNDDAESVLFNEMYKSVESNVNDEFISMWNTIYAVRSDVSKALEEKRSENVIGKSLEAKVELYCSDELKGTLAPIKGELAELFICSQVELKDGKGEFSGEVEGLSITVQNAEGEKCERCWMYSETVGNTDNHETLCKRCANVLDK